MTELQTVDKRMASSQTAWDAQQSCDILPWLSTGLKDIKKLLVQGEMCGCYASVVLTQLTKRQYLSKLYFLEK